MRLNDSDPPRPGPSDERFEGLATPGPGLEFAVSGPYYRIFVFNPASKRVVSRVEGRFPLVDRSSDGRDRARQSSQPPMQRPSHRCMLRRLATPGPGLEFAVSGPYYRIFVFKPASKRVV